MTDAVRLILVVQDAVVSGDTDGLQDMVDELVIVYGDPDGENDHRGKVLEELTRQAERDPETAAHVIIRKARELLRDPLAGVRSWADMQALPELEWIVDELLPVGGLSLAVGHPKAGKSTLARVLAAEVAGHGDGRFLGREVMRTGPVLYYSPDEAPQMIVSHFRGILPSTATDIQFVERADLAELGKMVEAGGHRLLIVDTLGRLFQAARFPDGDSYMAWQTHLDQVRCVATGTGCHICLLHHARKSGGERSLTVLGSAAIAGSADAVISITTEENEDGGGYARYIESTNRAGVEIARQKLVLAGDGWLTVDPGFEPGTVARSEAKAMRRDGMSVRQIATTLGITKSRAYRWTR